MLEDSSKEQSRCLDQGQENPRNVPGKANGPIEEENFPFENPTIVAGGSLTKSQSDFDWTRWPRIQCRGKQAWSGLKSSC